MISIAIHQRMVLKILIETYSIGGSYDFPLSFEWISMFIKHNIIDRNEVIILNIILHLFPLLKNSFPIYRKGRIVKVNQRFVIFSPFSINSPFIFFRSHLSLLNSRVKQNIFMRLVKITLFRYPIIIINLLMLLKPHNLRVHDVQMINRYLKECTSIINSHKYILSIVII